MNTQTIEAAREALRNAPKGVYTQNTPKEPTQIFYSEGKYGVSDSLKQCLNAGYQALFVPELAFARVGAEEGSELLTKWYVTPSVRATGTTKQGSKVVVYSHIPTEFIKPANIRNLVENGKLVNGAGPMSQEEFNSLVALDGNGRVSVIPYETLKQSSSGVINVDDALDHPQTFPFFCGKDIAEKYLAKHKQIYGDQIGIWHSDDFNERTSLGRVLCLGDGYYSGLGGDGSLGSSGQVFGVAPEAQPVAKNLEDKL